MAMGDKAHILVVDDDSDLLAAHALHLKSLGYEVSEASDGEQALRQVEKHLETLDVVLADIIMPTMDGYELCRKLKAAEETRMIPVIFVTQLDTLEEKMKGFDVGADDYITKPITPAELALKIKGVLDYRIKNRELLKQVAESQSVAMEAMTYSSDLGKVLEFYKNTLNANNFNELAELLFEATRSYGLQCTLQVMTPSETLSFGDKGAVSPLESNVIELARHKGRFFDFGARTLINYDDFSILIKNMPVEDQTRYGALKDALGTFCNAVEASVKFLLYKSAAAQKEKIIALVLEVLEDVDASFSEIQARNVAIISNMMDDLDEAMLDLGLTDHQEELVREIALTCREDSNEVFKQGMTLYKKIESMRVQLDRILGGAK